MSGYDGILVPLRTGTSLWQSVASSSTSSTAPAKVDRVANTAFGQAMRTVSPQQIPGLQGKVSEESAQVIGKILAAANKVNLPSLPPVSGEEVGLEHGIAISSTHIFVHFKNVRGAGASKRVYGALAINRATQQVRAVVHKKILDSRKFSDVIDEVIVTMLLKDRKVDHLVDPPLAAFIYQSRSDQERMVLYEPDAGRALKQHLSKPEIFVPALQDAATGLQNLHDQGYVHGDVTRGNIFVASQSVLGDLGATVQEGVHEFRGCQAYRPPEEFHENTEIHPTKAGDIWSIGCVLHELLSAGELPPFVKGVWAQRLQSQWRQGQRPDRLTERDVRKGLFNKADGSDATRRLKEITLQCLSVDPEERPTAAELVELFAGAI